MATLTGLLAKANALALAYQRSIDTVIWVDEFTTEQVVSITHGFMDLNQTTQLQNTGSSVTRPRRNNGVLSMINPHVVPVFLGVDEKYTLEIIEQKYPIVYDEIITKCEQTKAMFNEFTKQMKIFRTDYQLYINSWRTLSCDELIELSGEISLEDDTLFSPHWGQIGSQHYLVDLLNVDIKKALIKKGRHYARQ